MATELVTVRELADAIGVGAEAEAAVHESLVADGVKVVEDWAGRIAVSAADAKRVVDKHRQEEAKWRERHRRELEEQHDAHQAQVAFDDAAMEAFYELQQENRLAVSAQDQGMLAAAARRLAWQHIVGKFPEAALSKVMIGPIQFWEPDPSNSIRLIAIPETVTDEHGRAKGGVSERVRRILGKD